MNNAYIVLLTMERYSWEDLRIPHYLERKLIKVQTDTKIRWVFAKKWYWSTTFWKSWKISQNYLFLPYLWPEALNFWQNFKLFKNNKQSEQTKANKCDDDDDDDDDDCHSVYLKSCPYRRTQDSNFLLEFKVEK